MNIVKTIIQAMYDYKYGTPYLTDNEYDELISKLPPYHPLRNITWDMIDMIYPQYNTYKPTPTNKGSQYYHLIKDYGTSKSIQTINYNNSEILYQYVENLINYFHEHNLDFDCILSLKMDGWNIKNYYQKNKLVLSHTRNSTIDSMIDTTQILSNITPTLETTKNNIATVSGEFVVRKTSLEYLRNKYNKRFANARNSASSFLHGKIQESDLKHSDYFAFALRQKEGDIFKYISDTYTYLLIKGFKVPPFLRLHIPYTPIKREFINSVMRVFQEGFNKMQDYYTNKFSNLYECDGVVMQPNSKIVAESLNSANNLSSGLVALKIGCWGAKGYMAKVTNIYFTKARVNRALMLEIEPTNTGFGTITKVDIDNVARALQHDIQVGDTIEFKIHSNQDIQFHKNLKGGNRNCI